MVDDSLHSHESNAMNNFLTIWLHDLNLRLTTWSCYMWILDYDLFPSSFLISFYTYQLLNK